MTAPCLECGSPVPQTARRKREFCCREHSNDFQNRRKSRGAEIYDLFRAMRRDRAKAKELDIWTEMCRLDTLWEDEDRTSGRVTKSYLDPERALHQLKNVRDRVPSTNVGYVRE